MTILNTDICNMALGKLGAGQIVNLADTAENTPEAIQCRLHFEQTRDALIRSHLWRFASARESLTENSSSPSFEFDNQFDLPDDFMRHKSVWDGVDHRNTRVTFAIEGDLLLTNSDSIDLRYIKKVTDPTKFDSLFVEVLILKLAIKLVAPLAGGAPELQQVLGTELQLIMPSVRALDRQETNNIGRNDNPSWNDARFSSGGARIASQLGG